MSFTWIIERDDESVSDLSVFLLCVVPVDGGGQYLAAAPVRVQEERLLNVHVGSCTKVTVIPAINFHYLKMEKLKHVNYKQNLFAMDWIPFYNIIVIQ